MPAPVTEDQIKDALKQVKYPGFNRDIISFGLLKGIAFDRDPIGILLAITTADEKVADQIRVESEQALKNTISGARFHVQVQAQQAAQGASQQQGLPGVKQIIAVASGKGGVGKSTVAANLACALSSLGAKTGLLDCDIYGPSIALMFGTHEHPVATEDNGIEPILQYNLKLMSMGFLLEDDAPAILRGPMVTRYTQQLLRFTKWGELDFLILDLPPGTGDIQLTIVQTVALSGAVIVTTPQDIALLDAKKGVAMFAKTNVKIFGIIENMSSFCCPHCGKETEIFSKGGGEREAERQGVPFLGKIPLDMAVREAGDRGKPIVVAEPSSPQSKAFLEIARKLREAVK
ncbi:MAG: Mrp/NBP35 family ATP-binding protein [Verrucomicrobiota bacterium]|nr:Mrp/NBP35 family ATP-binding protein [Verrucomicrobiota bacterium]